jgi:putative membrane protein
MRTRVRTILLISSLLTLLVPTVAGAAPKRLTEAQIFGILAAANNGEIEAANLAQQKSVNQNVKTFADNMIKDHTQMQMDAQALATKLSITPADSNISTDLKSGADKEMEKLRTVEGPEFDKAYAAAQVADHTKVLSLIDKKLLPSAKNEEVKTMLQKARPTIAEHLEHAKTLEARLKKGKATMGDNP